MNVESPVVAEVRPCEGAQILARVGSQLILASEVTPAVDRWLAQIEDRIPPEELQTARKMATVKMLEDLIERKLVYQDARRRIPAEGLENLEKRLAEHFEEEVLPKRIEEAGVESRRELEEKLHSAGTSLEQQKRLFVEQGVKEVWQRDQKESESDVSHDEMLAYYHEHVGEFTTRARARWEELWVRIPRYTDGREAYEKLAYLGNQVMRGVPMDEALQSQPKDAPECQGRSRGWITRDGGDLSDVLDQAVFGLPVGRLSRILKDTDGFHIVRVLERQEAECTPFEDAQVKIREKIRQRRNDEREQEYLAELRRQIPVWTVFDDDPQAAQLLRESATMRR